MNDKYSNEPFKKGLEEVKEFRIEQLERLIPELVERVEKKSGRRLLIAYLVISAVSAFLLWKIDGDMLFSLFFSLIIGVVVMIITYIIGSLTFFKNIEERMIIEKLITELNVLNGQHEDLSTEIHKIRGSFYID